MTSACGLSASHLGSQATKGAFSSLEQQIADQSPNAPPVGQRVGAGTLQGALNELNQKEQLEKFSKAMSVAISDALLHAASRPTSGAGENEGTGGSGEAGMQAGNLSPVEVVAQRTARTVVSTVWSELERRLSEHQFDEMGMQLSASVARGAVDELERRMNQHQFDQLGAQLSASVVRGAVDELAPRAAQCTGPDREECLRARAVAAGEAVTESVVVGVRRGLAWPLLGFAFVAGGAAALLASLAFSRTRSARAAPSPRS
jgi:hypothetical protein